VSPRRFALIVLLAVVLGACGGGSGGQSTTGQSAPSTTGGASAVNMDAVQTFPVEASHAEGPLAYPQTPPVGGAHNPTWVPCAVYDVPVPNEKAVHSLEHGAVWITYRPDLAAGDIASLAALARGKDHVLVSPFTAGLPAPVVITSWGRQLQVDSATDPRLAEFIRIYINRGPERVAC
jgi:hypothetical protein